MSDTNEPIRAITATVKLSDTLEIDGYLMPNEEFRAGIGGSSVILGYAKNWFNRLRSDAPNKLKAFRDGGLTGYTQPVIIPRPSGSRGASRAQTISLKDLTILITIEAQTGNKRAIAIQSAFTLEGFDSRFRDAFGKPQLSSDTKRKLFGMTFEEYLEALAENRAELDALRLPADDLYYDLGDN